MGRARALARAVVATGALASMASTVLVAVNLRRLLVPDVDAVAAGATVDERVSVLLPVRDERANVQACLRALLASRGVPDLEVLVLDDGSVDGTLELVREVARTDPRVHVLRPLVDGADGAQAPPADDPPTGWLGKPWACARLADAATGSVLVLVDADVVVAPEGLAATVRLLRDAALDMVSPYPRQVAVSRAERLVQPLLQWSWLSTVPLWVARRSSRPSLAVANGQLLAVDAPAYRRSGGHGATSVRGSVLDDVELLRAVLRAGGHGTVADGTQIATCRMYQDWGQLRDGYDKSLWSAFGSPAGALAVATGACAVWVVPAVAALAGSPVGMVGWASAVAGRAAVARRVGGRVWPDSLAHPVSVAVAAGLVLDSLRRHRAGSLRWKGRPVR